MSSATLRDFVTAAVEMNRVRFADLRRLQRDILPRVDDDVASFYASEHAQERRPRSARALRAGRCRCAAGRE